MFALIKSFLSDETGLETVEYGLWAGMLTAVGVVGAAALWSAVQNKFTEVGTWIAGLD